MIQSKSDNIPVKVKSEQTPQISERIPFLFPFPPMPAAYRFYGFDGSDPPWMEPSQYTQHPFSLPPNKEETFWYIVDPREHVRRRLKMRTLEKERKFLRGSASAGIQCALFPVFRLASSSSVQK